MCWRISARRPGLAEPHQRSIAARQRGSSGRARRKGCALDHCANLPMDAGVAVAETRKIAAILAADVVGFSRLTGADEDGTLAALRTLRAEHADPTIAAHNGRLFKRTGGGFLVEFRKRHRGRAVRGRASGQDAGTQCRSAFGPPHRISYRVHLGDVVEEADGDLMGDGVNIAARLEGICEPNCVCLSRAAYDQIRDKLDCHITDLGEKELKNIRRPVRAYQIETSPAAAAPGTAPSRAASGRPLTDRASLAVLPFQNLDLLASQPNSNLRSARSTSFRIARCPSSMSKDSN